MEPFCLPVDRPAGNGVADSGGVRILSICEFGIDEVPRCPWAPPRSRDIYARQIVSFIVRLPSTLITDFFAEGIRGRINNKFSETKAILFILHRDRSNSSVLFVRLMNTRISSVYNIDRDFKSSTVTVVVSRNGIPRTSILLRE